MKYQFHKDGTLPQSGEIFVFGSNLAGVHGAGAAKAAYDQFGAVLGRGVGLQGRSFAIPTKDGHIETIPLDQIACFVDYFLSVARYCAGSRFFITRIGCGLAGYTDSYIAPMFKGAPNNCSFPEEWEKYL